MDMTKEMLLYIAYNLMQQSQAITGEGIQKTLVLMSIRESVDVEKEMVNLIEGGYLKTDSRGHFEFTEKGMNESYQISKRRSKYEFNQQISLAISSAAYLDFCEEIYGYRMYLFNMMDKRQLDYLFNAIDISQSDTVLDLGCGAGSVLDYLVKKYGCNGIGIDQLDKNIVEKNCKIATYIDGDMDVLSEYKLTPNITIAIDSLYFSDNLGKVIDTLRTSQNNILYLFYSQYVFDESEGNKDMVEVDKTRMAKALQGKGIRYKVIDFCENEHSLYENAIRTLPKYKSQFEIEGNADFYETKLREYIIGKEMYDRSMASRYLYIVE